MSSTELSEAVQVDSATIRRDFSYFGELGKRGYGYDVEDLMHFFAKTLNDDQLTNVALIGVGNLGSALLKYKFHQSNSIRISCAFDVNEEIVGRIVDGIPVYPMEDMSEQIKIQQIEVAILTIPAERKTRSSQSVNGSRNQRNLELYRCSIECSVRCIDPKC